MKSVQARVALSGGVLYLRPEGLYNLANNLQREGFFDGEDVVIVPRSEQPAVASVLNVNEVRELLDSGGEPAEVVARFEAWWDDQP